MVLGKRDYPVSSRTVVLRDPIGAVEKLDSAGLFANPDILAGVLPRHRIAAALPCYVCIARHAPRPVFGKRVWRPVTDRLKRAAFGRPTSHGFLVCSPVHALIPAHLAGSAGPYGDSEREIINFSTLNALCVHAGQHFSQ